ncbi:MAG: sensor histidine kinase, partial [Gloeobacteraceae cyanobacterium ES-bin-316]|nr:sensor histidine kinase [Ferruginibacter sp.]
ADDSAKVTAYHILASLTVGTDAAAAIDYAKKGIVLAKQIGYVRGVASCSFNVAYSYGLSGNLNAAVLYIDSAIVWYKKLGKPDRLALCYHNRADYKMQLGKLKSALKDCDTSFKYTELANRLPAKAAVYRTFGTVYFLQQDYDQSKDYYLKAFEIFKQFKDSIPMAFIMNKLGAIHEQKKEYDLSIQYYEEALRMSAGLKHENNFSTYYCNLSQVWLKKGDRKKAEWHALKALEYAKKQKNKLQQATAQKVLSNVYLNSDSTANAVDAAAESYVIATGIQAKDVQQSSSDALANSYFKMGNYKKAFEFLSISKNLSDSMAKEKFGEELAGLQTSFKVLEKDKEILLLNKEKKLQQQAIVQQRIIMVASFAFLLLAVAGVALLLNRNKMKQQMKELQLRNQIAADLHDEVGSSLSSIHMLSQMASKAGDETTHKNILAKMSSNAKETMDKMGDIVWMIKPGEKEAISLKERMENFANVICSSKNMEVKINIDEVEKMKLSMEQRKNVYLIFKEAINNAVKYSGSEKIEVSATLLYNKFTLQIKDFGKGFMPDTVARGNGLDNMKNRAVELHGMLTIDSLAGKGTSTLLNIPI